MEVMEVFIEELIPEEDLVHYGKSKLNGAPKGSGRYPLGSGENPYHHGQLSPFGKLKKKIDKKRRAKNRKQEKARKAMEKPVETAEQREERKQKALKTGTATDIAPFLKEMSTQEIRQARERLEEQERFMKLVVKETPEAQRAAKMDQYMEKVKKGTQYVNTGIGAYNAVARTHNAFSNKEWPVIPAGGKTNKEIKSNKSAETPVVKLTRNEKKNAKRDNEIAKLQEAINVYEKDKEIKALENSLKEYRKSKRKRKQTDKPQEP